MIKLIALFVVTVTLSSCSLSCSSEPNETTAPEPKPTGTKRMYYLEETTLGQCQYVVAWKRDAISIIHKPNCSNIHKAP